MEIISDFIYFWKEEVPGWVKKGFYGLVVSWFILASIYTLIGPERTQEVKSAVELKENLTKQTEDIAIDSANSAATAIQNSFDKAGKDIARDVGDPEAKKTIENSMSFAGSMLGLVVILTVILALTKKK